MQNTPNTFEAGKISLFYENWTQLTSDKLLLNVVKNGYEIEFESNPCRECQRSEIKFNGKEEIIIDELIKKLVCKKVIEQVTTEQGQVMSNIL